MSESDDVTRDWLSELNRYGLGEFVIPRISTWLYRRFLLWAMQSECQLEIDHLRRSALPLYVQLYHSTDEKLRAHSDFAMVIARDEEQFANGSRVARTRLVTINAWPRLVEAAAYSTSAAELVTVITNWARTYNVLADWFCEAILHNLLVWRISGPDVAFRLGPASVAQVEEARLASGPGLDWDLFIQARKALAHSVPPPSVPPLDPFGQTYEEHKAQVERTLQAYYERCQHLLEKFGATKAPAVAKSGADLERRAQRFVRYQMKKWTGRMIADAEDPHGKRGPSAVSRSVKEFAEVVQLPLRKPASGRPRKKLRRKQF